MKCKELKKGRAHTVSMITGKNETPATNISANTTPPTKLILQTENTTVHHSTLKILTCRDDLCLYMSLPRSCLARHRVPSLHTQGAVYCEDQTKATAAKTSMQFLELLGVINDLMQRQQQNRDKQTPEKQIEARAQ